MNENENDLVEYDALKEKLSLDKEIKFTKKQYEKFLEKFVSSGDLTKDPTKEYDSERIGKTGLWHFYEVSDAEKMQRQKSKEMQRRKLEKETQVLNNAVHSKKLPIFDYEAKLPAQDVRTINELEVIIVKNFPSIWFETKACLSAFATLCLKNPNGCTSLNLVGAPSGEKTTTLSFFYGQHEAYISDDFTPKAFVSNSANVKEDELASIDLLPKLKNKCLISPELAPLFEAPKDELISNFSMLTRVLDGEGLHRDSGTHGHRGYSGDYKFVWLGATTPLRSNVWSVMGKLGNRLFFLNMSDKNRADKDYLEMFRGIAYEEKVKICRGAVSSFLDNLFATNGIRSVEWDAEKDILLLPEIIRYAKFLSRLRASLMTWKSDDRTTYEYSFPIVEEPPRAINSLYNLAKGHALIDGRKFLKLEDLEVVRAVCFSSMPHDRSEFLKVLAKHEGRLASKVIQDELNCSQDTALRTMKTFEILGVVTVKSLQLDGYQTGRPMDYVEINPEYAELLAYTQGRNNAINIKSQEIRYGSEGYDDLKLRDFISKESHSHSSNNAINTLSQENNPVYEQKLDKIKQIITNGATMDEIAQGLNLAEKETLDLLKVLELHGEAYTPKPRYWKGIHNEVE